MNCLIVVDIQNDFLPGGALAVPGGDEVIPVINRLQDRFDLVLATQDWHPSDHGSFAANHPGHKIGEVIDLDGVPQILWPVHCVQDSAGAQFSTALDTTRFERVFRKGIDRNIDSYSTFFDNAKRRSTGLAEYLRQRNVHEIFICGLATDYCVRFSALDAVELSHPTTVVEDACRGVNLQPDDSANALRELLKAGVTIQSSSKLLASK
ncbi:MAG: bifunctional nicotinamidase/pyrazinamidase [Chthoniobacterales bacterium]